MKTQISKLALTLLLPLICLLGCSDSDSDSKPEAANNSSAPEAHPTDSGGGAAAPEKSSSPPVAQPKAKASSPETPQEAIHEIVRIFQSGDFDSLVRTRFAGIEEAEDEAQIKELIGQFKEQFSDPELVKGAVSDFSEALKVEPAFSDGGKTAVFKTDFGELKLSKMGNGNWGFHL